MYCLQPPQLAEALCSRHYDEVDQREQHKCVEIIESVAGCLSESPERMLFTSPSFHKKERSIEMEQQHQSITIAHSKFKV